MCYVIFTTVIYIFLLLLQSFYYFCTKIVKYKGTHKNKLPKMSETSATPFHMQSSAQISTKIFIQVLDNTDFRQVIVHFYILQVTVHTIERKYLPVLYTEKCTCTFFYQSILIQSFLEETERLFILFNNHLFSDDYTHIHIS